MSTKSKTKKARFVIDDEKDKKNKDCVYFFRMDGCGHCEHFKPIWNEVMKSIKESHPSVNFIEVESAEISKLDDYTKSKLKTDEIMGYPDLRILKKNGESSTFQSNRTVDEVVKWINENTTKGLNIDIRHKSFKRIPTPYPVKTRHHRGGYSLKGGKGKGKGKGSSRNGKRKKRTLRKIKRRN